MSVPFWFGQEDARHVGSMLRTYTTAVAGLPLGKVAGSRMAPVFVGRVARTPVSASAAARLLEDVEETAEVRHVDLDADGGCGRPRGGSGCSEAAGGGWRAEAAGNVFLTLDQLFLYVPQAVGLEGIPLEANREMPHCWCVTQWDELEGLPLAFDVLPASEDDVEEFQEALDAAVDELEEGEDDGRRRTVSWASDDGPASPRSPPSTSSSSSSSASGSGGGLSASSPTPLSPTSRRRLARRGSRYGLPRRRSSAKPTAFGLARLLVTAQSAAPDGGRGPASNLYSLPVAWTESTFDTFASPLDLPVTFCSAVGMGEVESANAATRQIRRYSDGKRQEVEGHLSARDDPSEVDSSPRDADRLMHWTGYNRANVTRSNSPPWCDAELDGDDAAASAHETVADAADDEEELHDVDPHEWLHAVEAGERSGNESTDEDEDDEEEEEEDEVEDEEDEEDDNDDDGAAGNVLAFAPGRVCVPDAARVEPAGDEDDEYEYETDDGQASSYEYVTDTEESVDASGERPRDS